MENQKQNQQEQEQQNQEFAKALETLSAELQEIKQNFQKIPDFEKMLEEKLKNIIPEVPDNNDNDDNNEGREKNDKNFEKIKTELEELKKRYEEEQKNKIKIKEIEKNREAIIEEAEELFATAGLKFADFESFIKIDYENPEKAKENYTKFFENLIKKGLINPVKPNENADAIMKQKIHNFYKKDENNKLV